METKLLFVKATTNTVSLGAAIAHAVYDGFQVEIRAVGDGALATAVKAFTIARGFGLQRGYDLMLRTLFTDVDFPDKTMTGVTLEVVNGS